MGGVLRGRNGSCEGGALRARRNAVRCEGLEATLGLLKQRAACANVHSVCDDSRELGVAAGVSFYRPICSN